MCQNNRAERDKSHFETRKCISTWQKRLFWSSTPLDFSLSFCPLFSLNLSCCPLHSGVHCHSAFGPLCIKKKETFIYKESIKASSKKDYLKQCSLERTELSIVITAHHSTLCFQITFHVKHVSVLNKWHSAVLASVHSGEPMQFLWKLKTLGERCTAGWARVTKWCQIRRLACHIPLVC